MGLLESAICRKCGQQEESSYHIHCLCLALARHNKTFGSAWLEPTDIRTSVHKVLVLALLGVTVPPKSVPSTSHYLNCLLMMDDLTEGLVCNSVSKQLMCHCFHTHRKLEFLLRNTSKYI
jgi:hypothetical protein